MYVKRKIDHILVIAEAFVLLNNMIVRMQINSNLWDESCGMDLITEFYLNAFELVSQCTTDYEAQRIRNRNEVVADCQQHFQDDDY